jgi:hypothetical protein
MALLAACVAPLFIYGAIQKTHSGTFAIVPTQGGFALWASDHSKANGLYYQQSLRERIGFHFTQSGAL